MSFVELYVSDSYDAVEELDTLNAQLGHLGFDPADGEFKTFAYFQTTEGYDTYYDLRQLLHLPAVIDQRKATIVFALRAIKEEKASDFNLNDMSVRLYMMEPSDFDKKAELSFGKAKGFPNKQEMVLAVKEQAIRKLALERSQGKARKVNVIINDSSSRRQRHRFQA